jgi:maltooligosyltrehalose trehalohydrolase
MRVFDKIWKLDLGATVIDPKGVSFRVWAPERDSVSVKKVSGKACEIPLRKTAQGYFTGIAEGVGAGDRYVYVLDQNNYYPDPASRFQPDGVHSPSQVIDPFEYSWSDEEWKGISRQDFIIYELHVGTFTKEGTFEAIIARLDYLRDLGITAIELMPVAQFPGNRNWGYDGVYPFAPQNTYGGPKGLKELINLAHNRGLAVILDVVYNHLGPEGNYLGRYGPYFTDRYKTSWGDALNFDGPYSDEVRHFFIDNALYWIDEFHIDALRLDAVHGIFDFSAGHFLRELSDSVHLHAQRLGREVSVIAESDLNDARIINPPEIGGHGLDAQWNDDFHHAVHALITSECRGYYEDFGKIGHLEKAFREGFTYTGQYSRYRKRKHGNSPKDRAAYQFIVFSQSHDQVGNRMAGDRLSQTQSIEKLKLAAGVVILAPFIPLFFMGEEYGETAPFHYFISHSDSALIQAVREGRKREFASFGWRDDMPDPQDEKTFIDSKLSFDFSEKGKALYRFYRELIRLRKEIAALHKTSKDDIDTHCFEDDKALLVRRWSNQDQVFSLYNFGDKVLDGNLALPEVTWEKILESSSREWGGSRNTSPEKIESHIGNISLRIAPHSFVLYRMLKAS